MLGDIVWRVFSFSYGVFNLVTFTTIATIRDRAFLNRTSKEGKRELEIAQKKYWSLDREPLPGFTHQFLTLRNGLKLHYVVNSRGIPASPKNVAIFIHGFPDSFLLWRNVITSSTLDSHILVAVDLPGYGGSGSLQNYGPDELLEAVAEFILGIREKYLKEEAKLVVVSHDWGGVIAARLASEANQLADRWVISSAVIPQHVQSSARAKAASAKQMVHTYLRNPLRISLLKNAFSTSKPVLSQIGRSFYVFVFNLPYPLSTFFATFGNYWLLRLLHKVAAGLLKPDGQWVRDLRPMEAADYMADSIGPGIAQIEESKGRYSDAVKARLGDKGMSEKIRIYRERVFSDPWEKSLETVVALSEIPVPASRSGSGGSGAGLFDDGPPGALRAPATVVYGKLDLGFERRLALAGIQDYMTKNSQVVFLEGSGHWLPFEELGSKVLRDVVEWSMGDEKNKLQDRFDGLKNVSFLVEK